MSTINAAVVLRLIDELSAQAKAPTAAIQQMTKSLEAFSAVAKKIGSFDAFRKVNEQAAGASRQVDRLTKSLADGANHAKGLASSMKAAGDGSRAAVDAANAIANAQARAERSAIGAARAARAEASAFSSAGAAARLASLNIGAHMRNQLSNWRPRNVAHSAYDATADLSGEIFKLRALGRSSDEIEHARSVARSVAKMNPLSTEAEGLKQVRELTGVYGDMHEALEQLPSASLRASYLKRLVPHETDPAHNLAKAAELLGVQVTTSAGRDRANHLQDMWAQSIAAAGGKLTSNDVFQFAKYQKGSARGLSDEMLGYIMPSIAQEMGGSTTGTSVSSFMRAMVGGHMTKQAISALNEYGLVRPDAIVRSKTGAIQGVKPDAMIQSDLLKNNTLGWIQDVLLPTLKAKGLTEQKQIAPVLSQIFSNRNAENLNSILAFDLARLIKESANARNSMLPSDAAKLMVGTDLTSGVDALKKSIATLAAEANIAAVGPAVQGMNAIAAALHSITGAVSKWTGGHAGDGKSDGGPGNVAALGIGVAGAGFAARWGLGLLRGRGMFGTVLAGGAVGAAVGGETGGLYGAATALTASAAALSAAAARLGGAPVAPGSAPGGKGSNLKGRSIGFGLSSIPLLGAIYDIPSDPAGLAKVMDANAARTARWNAWMGGQRPEWMKPWLPFEGDPKRTGPQSDATLGATGRFSSSGTDVGSGFARVPLAAEWGRRQLEKLPTAMTPDLSDIGTRMMESISSGMQKSASLVTGQMTALMGTLQGIAGQGINIPIHADTGGVSGAVQNAIQKASSAAKSGATIHNTFNVHGNDPDAVARKVHARFNSAVEDHLSDVGY